MAGAGWVAIERVLAGQNEPTKKARSKIEKRAQFYGCIQMMRHVDGFVDLA